MSKFVTRKVNGYNITFYKEEDKTYIYKILLKDKLIYESCDKSLDTDSLIEKHNTNIVNLLKHKENFYTFIDKDTNDISTFGIFTGATFVLFIFMFFIANIIAISAMGITFLITLGKFIQKVVKSKMDKVDLSLVDKTIDYELRQVEHLTLVKQYGDKAKDIESKRLYSNYNHEIRSIFDGSEENIEEDMGYVYTKRRQ